ncbi:FAD-binding protein [Candidatus Sumerlaeota bacterium]|nr:FAD-binding protein [Candidatus Sumerlaeota bacterium]
MPESAINSGQLEQALRTAVRGDIAFDELTRGIYATDASNYLIQPIGVVAPLDTDDARAAVKIAAQYGVAVVPRGGGTGLAGQAIGQALIIDLSKHMNRILSVDQERRIARVQPGVVRDELNRTLKPMGLHFAPDPATSNRCNVGGMIGNNSSGTHSILYGKTVDHTHSVTVVMDDGELIEFGPLHRRDYERESQGDSRKAAILREFREIVTQNKSEIERRYPKIMRRVTGYNLDEFIKGGEWNLAKLIVGSEGTLGMVVEAEINLEPLPAGQALCVAHFADFDECIRAVPRILEFNPTAVELLDGHVLGLARENPAIVRRMHFIEGEPEGALICEFFGDSPEYAAEHAAQLAAALKREHRGYAWPVISDSAAQANVWSVRKDGLGILSTMRTARKPIAFIEDAVVPNRRLDAYVSRLREFCDARGVELTLYAHASVGELHIRPMLDLRQADDIRLMREIARCSFELVKEFGGAISGEHGDGIARSEFIAEFFGPQIYEALRQVKGLFDPHNRMNPGKIVDPPPMDSHLRYGVEYRAAGAETWFHFRNDRGFINAVEMCSGVGACRKTGEGVMCPSYIATRDEEHSTRGRANALRLTISGQFPGGLGNPRLFDAMSLCLSCKGCKAECPSMVDMARLKSETLAQRHKLHGAPLRDRLIAHSPVMAKFVSGPLAPAVNAIQASALFRSIQSSLLRVSQKRTLPAYARRTCSQQLKDFNNGANESHPTVALFIDTWAEHHDPQIGLAAARLLSDCGYRVEPIHPGCCQRPRISKGFLKEAKRDGEKTLRALDEYIQRGMKIVCLEPSCCSALTDDLPDLIDDESLGRRIAANVMMLEDFLDTEIQSGAIQPRFAACAERLVVHGHCHQKALYGIAPLQRMLERSGAQVEILNTGCCGMAGSFGYEREHYELSQKIGEDRLFPALRALPDNTQVICNGFSCRHQVKDALKLRAIHWVEALSVVKQ